MILEVRTNNSKHGKSQQRSKIRKEESDGNFRNEKYNKLKNIDQMDPTAEWRLQRKDSLTFKRDL